MNKIFIVTGKIGTGKTTRLSAWVENQKSIAGILQPVINNIRNIKCISTGEIRQLELQNIVANENVLSIGNYIFDKNTFEWAKIALLADASLKLEWLIIDEFGKLEFDEKGLEPVITFLINDAELREETKIIIVIRDYLLEDFLKKFSLGKDNYEFWEV